MLHERSPTGTVLRGRESCAALMLLLCACSLEVRPKSSGDLPGDRDEARNGVNAPEGGMAGNAGAMMMTMSSAAGAGGFADPMPIAGEAGSTAADAGIGTAGEPAMGGGGTAGEPAMGSAGADSICAQATAETTPITPTIWLVVDGSSTMDNELEPGVSRWDALRATLMGPSGVVPSLEHVARIGLVIYRGTGGQPGMTECVQLISVDPALDNFAVLDAQYPQERVGMGTPTDRALEHVVTSLPAVNADMLDQQTEPVYVVLATDGAPNDICGSDEANVEQAVFDVTARGAAMGMDMFVVSLAGGDAQVQAYLEQVAQATRSQTPPFAPVSQADLLATFLDVAGSTTCRVALHGTVTEGRECSGEMLLDGEPLACASDDGWRLAGPRTVELTGSACERFRSSASQLHASFPCDAFSPD